MQRFPLAGISPNLLLIFVCCSGFIRGKKHGMYMGFCQGFCLISFMDTLVLSVWTAYYSDYLGYINGLFNEIFYTDDICIPVLLTMASDLAYNFLYYCVTFLLRGYLDIANYFKAIIFPEVIYTAFVAVFIFRLLKVISTKLTNLKKEVKKNLLKEIWEILIKTIRSRTFVICVIFFNYVFCPFYPEYSIFRLRRIQIPLCTGKWTRKQKKQDIPLQPAEISLCWR